MRGRGFAAGSARAPGRQRACPDGSALASAACRRLAHKTNSYVQDYDERNPSTYKGLNLHTMSMAALYTHFGLDAQTVDFIGHALALHRCRPPRGAWCWRGLACVGRAWAGHGGRCR